MDSISIGRCVIFTDEHFKDHYALVTAIWGDPDQKPAINLLYVCDDAERTDQYGRQIERKTSCVHVDNNSAAGWAWRYPGEKKPAWPEVIK
jgi:hypothetical protein